MDNTPDRESVIELLEKLGESGDTEVLATARDLHGMISNSGLTWDDLLVPDADTAAAPDTYDDFDEDENDDDETEDGEAMPDPEFDDQVVPSGEAGEDTKLITRLLERKEISASLREELEGYKEDIKEGDFTAADRQYLKALRNRLSSSSKSRTKDA
jgi:hypothetical protein